ncbi:MAG: hypothetical protein ACJAV0_000909 [Shewanella sp.]|jgi:hypothetical protein|tara:strand:- start:1059 stop:1208 length:150 start_codon:yes stop_codon:yes gene_type:complete
MAQQMCKMTQKGSRLHNIYPFKSLKRFHCKLASLVGELPIREAYINNNT